MKRRSATLVGALALLLLCGCGASSDGDKVRETADADAPTGSAVTAVPPPAVDPAPPPPPPTAEAPAAPGPSAAPAADGAAADKPDGRDEIVELDGRLDAPIDLGGGLAFTLGRLGKWRLESNGAPVPADQVLVDEATELYFSHGACWRTRTVYTHCDGELQLFYRRIDGPVTDLGACREALSYELGYPFVGAQIDPGQLYDCQIGAGDCPPELPARQFRCKQDADCDIATPDSLCCAEYGYVAYNRQFEAQVNARRQQRCAQVKCHELPHLPGYPRARCVNGRCALNPHDRVDEQGAFCL